MIRAYLQGWKSLNAIILAQAGCHHRILSCIGPGEGLVVQQPDGNKQIPEPVLTAISEPEWGPACVTSQE